MKFLILIVVFFLMPNLSNADECESSHLKKFCLKNGGTCSRSYCVGLPLPKIDWKTIDSDYETECKNSGGNWTADSSYGFNDCDVVPAMTRRTTANIKTGCKCKPVSSILKKERCWIVESKNPNSKGTCIDAPSWNGTYKHSV